MGKVIKIKKLVNGKLKYYLTMDINEVLSLKGNLKTVCLFSPDACMTKTGVIGILMRAKKKSLIKEIKPMLDKLRTQAHFWIKQDLYDAILHSTEL